MKRILWVIAFVLCGWGLFGTVGWAQDIVLPSVPLPEELADSFGGLPENPGEVANWLDGEKVLSFAADRFSFSLENGLAAFLSLTGVSALSAVMGMLCLSIGRQGVMNAFDYTALLCGAVVMLAPVRAVMTGVEAHVATLSSFATGVIPLYMGVCTACGMNGLGIASGAGLSLAVSFSALLCSKILLPMLHCCLLLGFSASVANLTGISQIAQSVRRFFVGMVGCVSAILTAVFAFQSVIAAKADTFGARTVRYVTTSVLPLVGGALSEASRTLSSAFSLVGGVLGGVGVAVVVLLLLPILLELWMLRLAFSAAGGMAQMLGCERLGMLYRQGGTLFGALLAIVSLLDAVLVFEFALMMKI